MKDKVILIEIESRIFEIDLDFAEKVKFDVEGNFRT